MPELRDMRKVLVPTDFSDASQVALQYAIGLANQAHAQIELFSAFHLPPPPPEVAIVPASGEYDELRADTEAALKGLAAEIADHCIHDPITRAVKGLGSDEILRVMAEESPWLTVMGTKGATGLERLVFGSVASEVAKSASAPLVLIPEDAKFQPLGQVLFATDFHDSDVEAVRHLEAWAREPEDLAITFLHISDGRVPEQFEQAHLEEFQAAMRQEERVPDMRFELKAHPDAGEAILNASSSGDYDLIVLAPVQRNWLMRLLLPSVTQHLIHGATRPTFVFPATDNA